MLPPEIRNITRNHLVVGDQEFDLEHIEFKRLLNIQLEMLSKQLNAQMRHFGDINVEAL